VERCLKNPTDLRVYADRESAPIDTYSEGDNSFALCAKTTEQGMRLMLVVQYESGDVSSFELLLARACGRYGASRERTTVEPYQSKFVLDITDYAVKQHGWTTSKPVFG
jgi:hypothetical protein